jgi:exodeoxyribonuclease-3
MPYLQELKASGRKVIICGDVNIVHQERDIKNWKANQKNSDIICPRLPTITPPSVLV